MEPSPQKGKVIRTYFVTERPDDSIGYDVDHRGVRNALDLSLIESECELHHALVNVIIDVRLDRLCDRGGQKLQRVSGNFLGRAHVASTIACSVGHPSHANRSRLGC